jgi:hypothetical protein
MTVTPAAAVVLDRSGRLRVTSDLSTTTPAALGEAVCGVVHQLAGTEASVVSCSVVGKHPRAFAMTMLRIEPERTFVSGTALADEAADAVAQAVLTALGLENNLLTVAATRWRTKSGVRAVTVIDGEVVTAVIGDDDDADAHVRLVETVPAPGRLAVTTDEADYRVLRYPAAALVVSTSPRAEVLQEIDAWMARAEALGP